MFRGMFVHVCPNMNKYVRECVCGHVCVCMGIRKNVCYWAHA